MSTLYNKKFYAALEKGALASAEIMVPFILKNISGINSVLDVGCGTGSWLIKWQENGVKDVLGVDGSYINKEQLKIPENLFVAHNLSEELDLKRKFDLVQCLEVAEHIDEKFADILIDNLTRHGDVIFFSSATPGQGGSGHINEKPHNYWQKKFLEHHFIAIDFLRPALQGNKAIKPWYRFNSIIYIKESAMSRLATETSKRSKSNSALEEYYDFAWWLRHLIVKSLPISSRTFLAKIKILLTTLFSR